MTNISKADEQRQALLTTVKEFHKFMAYAEHDSRYAVPGEVDQVIEALYQVAALMYPPTSDYKSIGDK